MLEEGGQDSLPHLDYTYSSRRRRKRSSQNSHLSTSSALGFEVPASAPISSTAHGAPQPSNMNDIQHQQQSKMTQMHLDFGQADFSVKTCSICGMQYAPGEPRDERTHAAHHATILTGIRFQGWQSERVVQRCPGGSRILMVQACHPPAHWRKVKEVTKFMEDQLGFASSWLLSVPCTVLLFVGANARIQGCLVTETIGSATMASVRQADQSHPTYSRGTSGAAASCAHAAAKQAAAGPSESSHYHSHETTAAHHHGASQLPCWRSDNGSCLMEITNHSDLGHSHSSSMQLPSKVSRPPASAASSQQSCRTGTHRLSAASWRQAVPHEERLGTGSTQPCAPALAEAGDAAAERNDSVTDSAPVCHGPHMAAAVHCGSCIDMHPPGNTLDNCTADPGLGAVPCSHPNETASGYCSSSHPTQQQQQHASAEWCSRNLDHKAGLAASCMVLSSEQAFPLSTTDHPPGAEGSCMGLGSEQACSRSTIEYPLAGSIPSESMPTLPQRADVQPACCDSPCGGPLEPCQTDAAVHRNVSQQPGNSLGTAQEQGVGRASTHSRPTALGKENRGAGPTPLQRWLSTGSLRRAAKVVSSAASLRQDSPTLHPAAGPLHPAANHPSCAMDTCDIMHQQASVHHQPAVSQRLAMVGDSNCGSQQPPAHNDISMGNESIPQHASARQCPPVSQPAAAVCFQGYPSMDDGRRLQLPLEAADAAAPMQDDATCCIDRSEQLSHNLPHPPRSCADPVVDGPSHQPFHTMQQDATDSVPAMKSHQDAVDSMPDTESHQDAAPCTPLAGRRRLIHSQASRVLDSGPASCGSNLKPCPKQCTHGEGAFASSSCKDGSDAGPGRDLTLPILMRSSKKVVASCGVRGIWVSKLCARQGIATMLLDAARCNCVCGYIVPKDEVAFSNPTGDGIAFALHYDGAKGSIRIYAPT